MSVFGGMSKGERNRIKIRVRTAMAAQAKVEGRFLGGRPPYGYLIADAGPHPNPAKAADGKRLHKLDLDPEAAPVVRRIFAEFIAGHGFYAIAEGLTRDGIPSPSAHDPARNKHRCGHRVEQVRGPRDPHQPPLHRPPGVEQAAQRRGPHRRRRRRPRPHHQASGGTTRTSGCGPTKIVHPPIIDRETFDQVQAMVSRARHQARRAQAAPQRTHPYALRGACCCGLCGRRMQSHWINGTPYYRCRFPAEYALANHVSTR